MLYLALKKSFEAPIEIKSISDFCSLTERAMKDIPANQNPIKEEFQVNNSYMKRFKCIETYLFKQNWLL